MWALMREMYVLNFLLFMPLANFVGLNYKFSLSINFNHTNLAKIHVLDMPHKRSAKRLKTKVMQCLSLRG